jgi:hypothetical protein
MKSNKQIVTDLVAGTINSVNHEIYSSKEVIQLLNRLMLDIQDSDLDHTVIDTDAALDKLETRIERTMEKFEYEFDNDIHLDDDLKVNCESSITNLDELREEILEVVYEEFKIERN